MMLPRKDWLSIAQNLPEGAKGMFSHSCGDGRKLLVEHKPTGYAAWCYRCGVSGWAPKGRPSLGERIASFRKATLADQRVERAINPPFPAVFDTADWPDHAKVWLYKAGLNKDWIEDLGIYYHAETDRVVLPVLNDTGTKLAFWQARGFSPERAKYLSPMLGSGQHKPVYKAAPSAAAPLDICPNTLCLTEDILSAVRVGQTCEAWSILGTSLTPTSEAQIVKFGASRVLVWLDPDAAGIAGRRKIVPRLRQLGLNARAVRADLDPKNYPFDDIRKRTHE